MIASSRRTQNSALLRQHLRAGIAVAIFITLVVLQLATTVRRVQAVVSPDIVISQVYGGGGNSGTVYKNDFIELFNRGSAPVDVSTWSVQYASATGSSWALTNLSGVIQPGRYYLVQEAAGTAGTTNLPPPDATGTIAMSATAGKVALVTNQTALTCGGTAGNCFPNAAIKDFVGYGTTANNFEGTGPAPAPSNTTADIRNSGGCTDTDNNAADFATAAPTPRNSSSPINSCGAPTPTPTATATPTPTASATPTPTPSPAIAIHDIQGSGSTSPLVSTTVTTTGIVTGLKSNGFFIQTPDASIDADPNTSEGILVFTSSAPAVTIGSAVTVTGTVQEFIPSADPYSPPETELSGTLTVTVNSTGNVLPATVTITSGDTTVNNPDNLERFEGMRVHIDSLTAISPTGGFVSEANATATSNGLFYAVVTGVARPFREPGIQIFDPVPTSPTLGTPPPNVPRFDLNPERLRVDSDAQPGAPKLEVTTGTVITNVNGVLDYGFRTYTILPDAATPQPIIDPATIRSATAVPVPSPDELTIASANMQRFFDTVNDPSTSDPVLTPAAFNNRLTKASLMIRNVMRTPDVIAVQEVENLTTLRDVAERVNNDSVAASQPNPNYQAYLVEGNDIGGIDVGFLVKAARVTVIDVVQIGKDTTYIDPNTGMPDLLNDRPPLVLRASIQQPSGTPLAFTAIAVHNRSLSGVDDPADGNRIRTKRRAQAEFLANYIQSRQQDFPTENLIALGDYNSFQFNDGYVDVIGTVKGTPAPPDQVVLASNDLVNPDLTDLIETLPADQRYSFTFDGNAQALDHSLVNSNFFALFNRFAYARTNADFPEIYRNDTARPERLSDHDPEVAYFSLAAANVTANVSTQSSGLYYSRVSRTYIGTITVTNTSSQTINGPLQVVLTNLTPGVTLVNATGNYRGDPYVTAPVTSLAPGQSVDVSVRFSNPTNVRIGYITQVYSGTF